VGRLSAVHEAVDRGEWQLALDALTAAGADSESPEGLELRARAHYGNGEFEASVSAWENLHALLVAEGDVAGAAMAASMVAMFLMMDTGLMAPVRGWLRRAERLLDGHGETPAHAIIAVVRGYERFMCGDMTAAGENAAQAIDVGLRLGVDPAVVFGRVCTAGVTIFNGQVDEGLELLDEIAIDLMSGAVDPLTTGMMYCELICAAQGMALHDRATEWTEIMDRWRHNGAIGGIGGRCRVHRAEILRVTGPCDAAEDEALGACEELRPWMRREFGWPLVELGNIRLRKGDLGGAEEAFMAAHQHAWSPHPGLALLRLAQGDADSASTMISDAILHPFDIPSKEQPPFGDLRLAPLFDAQAEIAAVVGDADTARRAAGALAKIAGSYPSRSLAASAALAVARVALLDGDLTRAIHEATAATVAWADIGAPFEAAKARLVLGEAHDRSGNADGARMERQAANTAFQSFGAARWAELAAGLVTPARSAPKRGSATTAIFRCEGDTRTICFGETTVLMHDLKGLRYVERLLADPGREFHVLDLIAVEQGSLPTGRTTVHGQAAVDGAAGVGLPMLDDQARDAYRRRLAEVDEDIEEATRMNDLGRVELAQHDRDYLIAELTAAAGLGGRHRTTGGTAERARTSVTRSIRYSLERLAEHHPAVAAHLGQSVNTGTYCVYNADPLAPITWNI
jgi:tetratricopeptide (TPR) repeat protein